MISQPYIGKEKSGPQAQGGSSPQNTSGHTSTRAAGRRTNLGHQKRRVLQAAGFSKHRYTDNRRDLPHGGQHGRGQPPALRAAPVYAAVAASPARGRPGAFQHTGRRASRPAVGCLFGAAPLYSKEEVVLWTGERPAR